MNEEAKHLARNLRLLMDHHEDNQKKLAKRSGVSQKTISNILNPGDEKTTGLDKIALIARAYNLQCWHLLYPNLPIEILANSSIEKFVDNYVHAPKELREAWARVAEVSAQYEAVAVNSTSAK